MEAIEHRMAARPPGASGSAIDRDAKPLRSAMAFRRFNLLPLERRLLHDGEPVEIGSRAFDLLLILAQSPGTIVGKSTIVDFVWPSTIVEECNLRFQMASLRKALGSDRDVIKTIPGRGYLFVGEVTSESEILRQRSLGEALGEEVERASVVMEGSGDRHSPAAVGVIDDDDDTREALDGLLRSSGFVVQCYSSVDAFVTRPAGPEPGCLVLDVCMPGRTGLELQADLARAGVRLPIIFISGHADIHMSVRAMKAGASEFLTKPVRHEELLDAVNGAIGRH